MIRVRLYVVLFIYKRQCHDDHVIIEYQGIYENNKYIIRKNLFIFYILINLIIQIATFILMDST